MSHSPDTKFRRATAQQVAALAGVTRWTVSRVFSGSTKVAPETRQRVLSAAKTLRYRPNMLASSLSRQRSNIVGLLVDNFGNPHILQLLDAVTAVLQQHGMASILLNAESGRSAVQVMLTAEQFQVDAILVLAAEMDASVIDMASNRPDIPFVVVGRTSLVDHIVSVNCDDYLAGRTIAATLSARGHRRLAYMAGPASSTTKLERLAGFRDGLLELHAPEPVVLAAEHYERKQGAETLSAYLASLSRDAQIDGLFCENDILALGAIDCAKHQYRLRIPEDLAVVGFDDIAEGAAPAYALTTYRRPLMDMVTLAYEVISETPETPQRDRRLMVPGELILRGTC